MVNNINGLAAQNAVSDNGIDFGGAVLVERLGSLGKLLWRSATRNTCRADKDEVAQMATGTTYSSASVSHVVNENGHLVLDITDEDHAADDVGAGTLLVDEGKGSVETVSDGGGTLGAAGVGRHNDAVFDVEVLTDPAKHRGLGIEVVHGDVEEALDLRGVEVHGDDVVLNFS